VRGSASLKAEVSGAKGIANWEARAVESSGAEASFPTCEDSEGEFWELNWYLRESSGGEPGGEPVFLLPVRILEVDSGTGICVQRDRLRDRVCGAPHSCWMVNLSDDRRG
jgi:hypothetical protein